MSANGHPTPEQIRSRLDHPVIDGDGHWVEFDPVFAERMRKVGGDRAADGFLAAMKTTQDALSMSVAERRRRRIAQPAFWSRQAENTLDRATAMMPRLLYERLAEFGSDFAIIYPTAGLRVPRISDDATRRAVVRAHNIVTAEYFRDLGDRMTPAAIIPMHTPEEAIAELEYVTRELGAKVGMFGSGMSRRLPPAAGADPDVARLAVWYDVLALDSDYDYDPVWAKCQELGIAPTFHSAGSNQGLRLSPSNFVYNHIGHFAAAGHAVSKAIFLGGVTRRFPELRFAFLEGGVGWACQLFGDLIEHWERRNAQGAGAHGPAQARSRAADEPGREVRRCRHGGGASRARRLARPRPGPDRRRRRSRRLLRVQDHPQAGLDRPLRHAVLFRLRGRRPDQRLGLRQGQSVRLEAQRDLQLGHRPLRRDRHARSAARGLRAGRGRADQPDNFRDFTFANAVHLWGTQNPRFFEGTAVAAAAAAELARGPSAGDGELALRLPSPLDGGEDRNSLSLPGRGSG